MSWKAGPMPADTWFWGGCTLVEDYKKTVGGFYFCDFLGNRVRLLDGREIPGNEIAFYDNCIEMPPTPKGASRDSAKRIG